MSLTATFDTTSEGKIVCKLFEAEAPETVKNFVGLAEGTKEWNSHSKKGPKLYDGTVFHRVIPEFMIQGGDPEGSGMGGPGYKFADETKGSSLNFKKPGKLAMANSGAEHQRQPVLHHRHRHQLADGQAHDLWRGYRGLRHRREDQPRAARRHGPAEDAGRAEERHDRTHVVFV